MFLRNYWYAAAWANDIGRELVGRTILNEPVVLYRKRDGSPVALENRCAHRRVELSIGNLIGDDVQCRYHGLLYDGTGKCIRVPGKQSAPRNIRVRSYPIVERHKLLWIWMGDAELADDSTIPEFPLLDDPAWCATGDYFHVPANYLLIVDNLCDLSHVAYLHSDYTGNEPVGELAETNTERDERPGQERVRGARWTWGVEAAQTYATFGNYDESARIDRWQIYEFQPPGIFRIYNGSAIAGSGASKDNPEGGEGRWWFRVYHAITPETEKTSHYFWVVMHDIGAHTPAVCAPLHKQMHSVLAQDYEIFANQQRNIDLDPEAPTHGIEADQGLVQARLLIDKLLRKETKRTGAAARAR